MTIDRLLKDALDLHDQGFIPLPLRQYSKHLDIERMGYQPLHFQTKRNKLKEMAFDGICFQFSQKPPTKNTIKTWFKNFQGNIGILGGYDGLVILDFDSENVFRLWHKCYEDRLGGVPVAKSPEGYHVFLRCKMPLTSSSMYYGFRKAGHLKSLGGYVVAAPSELNKRECYQWVAKSEPTSFGTLEIENIDELGLAPMSPIKSIHDNVLNRGSFEPE
jgi:hypothetical protein